MDCRFFFPPCIPRLAVSSGGIKTAAATTAASRTGRIEWRIRSAVILADLLYKRVRASHGRSQRDVRRRPET